MGKWKCLKSKIVFDSKYFRVRKDLVKFPSGLTKEWTYWDSKDSVMVVGMIRNKLILLRQYRYLVGGEVIELPSGGIKKGESPELAAKREFKEETGYKCSKLIKLGSFYETFGQLNRQIHIFFSKNIIGTSTHGENPEFEETFVELIDFDKVIDLATDNSVVCTPSAFAVLLLKEKINKGEIKI